MLRLCSRTKMVIGIALMGWTLTISSFADPIAWTDPIPLQCLSNGATVTCEIGAEYTVETASPSQWRPFTQELNVMVPASATWGIDSLQYEFIDAPQKQWSVNFKANVSSYFWLARMSIVRTGHYYVYDHNVTTQIGNGVVFSKDNPGAPIGPTQALFPTGYYGPTELDNRWVEFEGYITLKDARNNIYRNASSYGLQRTRFEPGIFGPNAGAIVKTLSSTQGLTYPLKLHIRLTFPPVIKVIYAIEPKAILSANSFFDVNNVSISYYAVKGTEPKTSDEIPGGPTSAWRLLGTTPLDKYEINLAGKFKIGSLFYKNYEPSFYPVYDPKTEYLVAQFSYDNDSSRSTPFLLSDYCIVGDSSELRTYSFTTPTASNAIVIMVRALSAKLGTLIKL